jgi:hypothetical protein
MFQIMVSRVKTPPDTVGCYEPKYHSPSFYYHYSFKSHIPFLSVFIFNFLYSIRLKQRESLKLVNLK